MRTTKEAVRRLRKAWSDAPVLAKGLRVVALPVLALVLTTGLVLAAEAQRDRSHDQREAAEAIAERAAVVRAISAKAAAVAGSGSADAATLARVMAFRGDWERALERVEVAALAEPDEAMQADVRGLRAATEELLAATSAAFAPQADEASAIKAGWRITDANEGFVAAMESISARANQRARDYADAYDRDAAVMSRLIVVSASVSAVGAIAAMVAFAVSIRRRVRVLEANSAALGEGRPLVPVPGGADELGRLGRGLDRAAALLRDREQALLDAAETLRQSEERLALAVEAGEMGTWDVNLLTGDSVWDAQAELQHGVPPGTFGGTVHAWLDTVHPDDRARVIGDGAEPLVSGGRWTTEYRLLPHDGNERWISGRGQAYVNDDGLAVRLVGVTTDVTGRKIGERRLRQAIDDAEQANQAKNDFLSRVSHELRTPLNAILGFSQLLEMDDLTETQQESVTQVLSGGRHLLGLIDDVLDISRIESGNLPVSMESTGVGEVIAETVAMVSAMAFERGVVIEVPDPAGPDPHVRADRRRLKQILVNLASNAVKYNRRDGLVAFTVSAPSGGRVRISVHDTGPGIPADRIGRLFTPFDRLGAEHTAVDGAGLGLALSQRLAETMGATLSVESVAGVGSTFSVDVPLAADPVLAAGGGAAEPAAAQPGAVPGGTVLYVEDNPSNLRLVQRVVDRRGGIRLLSAVTGGMALSLASRIPVDLVLLDLHLPDMNGTEVLRRLRERPETRHTPVVVVSADAMPGQLDRLRDAGADAFLAKPFDLGTFLGVLDDYLAVLA